MKIKILTGDIITLQVVNTKGKNKTIQVDAIVNPANNELLPGGTLSGAIHAAAGPNLTEECRKLNGCETGQAVITAAHNLPVKYIIHTVGPFWEGGTNNEEKLLASCHQKVLELAVKNKIKTIAFPCISTGAFCYPPEKASKVAIKSVISFLKTNKEIKKVYFITVGANYSLYNNALNQLKN
jgi:O-acetyl-ADP-ribose deacetylase